MKKIRYQINQKPQEEMLPDILQSSVMKSR